MEFLEGSRGIYRPIRVLFDTKIYDRALQICWNLSSYKSQIALLMQLLRLQQENQINPQVTAEDMMDLLLEQSKSTLRERLWEFELEDFDMEDAKPLLALVWAVNVCNKMRDVEFEAKLLLNYPEAVPPNFQHPKILSLAQHYANILKEKHQEMTKLLCPKEVVIEVVPRVLQGFWVLPQHALLNMPSQLLSKMSVGVTKAVLDQVSSALTTVEHQATFTRSIRDDMVLSILTKIRQSYPHDVLVNRIKSFAPVLLSNIVDVAVGHICEMFQPQSPKVTAHLKSDGGGKPSLEECPEPTTEVDSAAVTAPSTPPAEPKSIMIQAREHGDEKPSLEFNTNPTRETDSAVVPATVAILTPPPVVITTVQCGVTKNLTVTEEPPFSPMTHSAEMSPPPPPALLTSPELPCITDVQDREDNKERPSLEEPVTAVAPASPAPLTPALEPVVIVKVHNEAKMTKKQRAMGFVHWLFQPLCSCFGNVDTED